MVRQILIGILTFETLLYRYLRWPDGNDGDGDGDGDGGGDGDGSCS